MRFLVVFIIKYTHIYINIYASINFTMIKGGEVINRNKGVFQIKDNFSFQF